jgi:3-methylfumaryl-CoA hydratase
VSQISATPPDIDALRPWIGRSEVEHDVVTEAPPRLLAATLDRERAPGAGEELPCLWHWLYFLPAARRSELGADGHATRGGFMPPVPLPRRMWAGSRIEFHTPAIIGEPIRRRSTIADVVAKSGRAGPLVFVRMRFEIYGSRGPILVEERDIVFRDVDRGAPSGDPPVAPVDAEWSETVLPDPVLLFRYSALTFNSHRIHYDRQYATGEEGYPGLVVTGPLIATLLAESSLAKVRGRVRRLSFRSVSPLFAGESFRVAGRRDGNRLECWAANPQGRLAMSAEAEVVPA